MTAPACLTAALALDAAGYAVIPVRRETKVPHITEWQLRLRHNPDPLRVWWRTWPAANVAILTGQGRVVLDVDGPAGEELVARLEATHGALPPTLMVTTGRLEGGRQLHYTVPVDADIKTVVAPFGTGLDIKSEGGMVLMPPSVHKTGTAYAGNDAEVVDLPAAWLAALPRRGVASQNGDGPRFKLEPGELIAAGARDDTLFRMASSLRAKGLGEAAIYAAVAEENQERCRPPLSDADVRKVTHSAAKYPRGELDGYVGHSLNGAGDQPPVAQGSPFELNDTGNARRLVATCGGDIRYVVDRDLWLAWCGDRWRRDENDVELLRRTRPVSTAIDAEVLACTDDDRRKVLRRWATTSGEEPRRRRMIELARAEREVGVRGNELDADPWALNVANGTIDLRTGTLRPHRRDDLITKVAPVRYDPAARSSLWERFMTRILPDESMRRFVQRCAGYAITGLNIEEKWFLPHGPTAGGKSTFLEAIRSTLGDYARVVSADAFMTRRDGGNATPEIALLDGVRFAASYEITSGRVVNEGLLKTFTGGEPVVGRELYKQPVSFLPAAKIFLAVNDRPKLRDTDDAMWRRVVELPFTISIPEEERDPDVKAELTDVERSGAAILAWAVDGCLAWQRDGLNPPDAARRATSEYKSEMDLVGQFLEDSCTLISDAWTSTARLVEAYAHWAAANGVKPYSGRELGQRFGRRGLKAETAFHTNERGWRGVALGGRS